MAYITIAQLIVHYSEREILQLSDKVNAKVRDDVVIQKAIDRASGIIDAALAKCYVLPLAMADGSALPGWMTMRLEEMCGRITRFLMTDDARLGGTPDQAPHETRARYNEEIKTLNALDPAKKGACLWLPGVVLNPNSADAASQSPSVIFGDSGSVWGRDASQSPEYADREFR